MRRFALGCAAVAVGLSGAALGQTKLAPGSKAPAIKVAKWFKGKQVPTLEPGKVYVVEFWATWCGPCRTSIPHLTELAKKYAGKVTFVGVSVWERDKDYIAKVDKFVKDMGDKMVYSVAADDAAGTMAKTWMSAAGEQGIPSAFVVDKQGRVAWIGHPMADLGPTLDKVLAGTWNIKTYADKRAKEKAAEEAMQAVYQKLGPLMQGGKYAEALAEVDAAMTKLPDAGEQLSQVRFSILMRMDEAKGQAYALELAQGRFKGNPMALNQLAWMIVMDGSQIKKPDFNVAVSIAKLAVEASEGKDPDILDTLGLAQFRAGQTADAVATQTKAVDLAVQLKRPEETIKDLKARLEQFKQAAK